MNGGCGFGYGYGLLVGSSFEWNSVVVVFGLYVYHTLLTEDLYRQ